MQKREINTIHNGPHTLETPKRMVISCKRLNILMTNMVVFGNLFGFNKIDGITEIRNIMKNIFFFNGNRFKFDK